MGVHAVRDVFAVSQASHRGANCHCHLTVSAAAGGTMAAACIELESREGRGPENRFSRALAQPSVREELIV